MHARPQMGEAWKETERTGKRSGLWCSSRGGERWGRHTSRSVTTAPNLARSRVAKSTPMSQPRHPTNTHKCVLKDGSITFTSLPAWWDVKLLPCLVWRHRTAVATHGASPQNISYSKMETPTSPDSVVTSTSASILATFAPTNHAALLFKLSLDDSSLFACRSLCSPKYKKKRVWKHDFHK